MAKDPIIKTRRVLRKRVLHMKSRLKRLEKKGTHSEGYLDKIRRRLSQDEQHLHHLNRI